MVVFLAAVQSAFGQTASECRLQSDPRARLACYDAIYPPDGSASDQPDGSKPEFTYSWAGVPSCRTLSRSPAFKFSNFPPNTRRVSLVLTQGEREFGGQEIAFPATGLIAEGTVTMRGPCVPGNYRWTAILKSAAGDILATVHTDLHFPSE
jgi:hypothetical protein